MKVEGIVALIVKVREIYTLMQLNFHAIKWLRAVEALSTS